MNGNMHVADRAALPAVARLYADNILNEPAIPPLLRDMADEIARLRITDAEREAVTEMAEVCDSRERRSMEFQLPEEAEYWRGRANILRGLLAKHKGGEL